jgi:hypothetical protein
MMDAQKVVTPVKTRVRELKERGFPLRACGNDVRTPSPFAIRIYAEDLHFVRLMNKAQSAQRSRWPQPKKIHRRDAESAEKPEETTFYRNIVTEFQEIAL